MTMKNPLRTYSQYYTWRLFFASGLLTLSSMNYAFDNQGFSQTQALDPFIRRFGEYNAKTRKYAIPPYFLSLLNSLPFIGFGAGIWIGSAISARFGRRWTVFTMSLWAIVCATIVMTSKEKIQMLMARILNYIYIGMEFSVIPPFQAELLPGPVRGFGVASYQLSLQFGGILMSCIIRGTSTLDTDAAWRIPLGLYYVVPTIVASLIWFQPESPRFLMLKGRTDHARRVLKRTRIDNDDISIDEELTQIAMAIEASKDSGSYRSLFQGTNRRRTLIVMISNMFNQMTGQLFFSRYGAIFVKSLNAINPFNYTMITTSMAAIACLASMFLTDHWGRRPLMMFGAITLGSLEIIMGGMGSIPNQTDATKGVIVTCLILCLCMYDFGWGPMNLLIGSEIPTQRLRDKTIRVGGFVNVFFSFVVTFTVPYLLSAPYANLNSKLGYVFGPICYVAAVYCYFFIPECRGRSLEEINLLFKDKVPARISRGWRPPNVTQELSEMAYDHGAKPEIEEVDDKVQAPNVVQRA